jgi:NAD(P)-dependent dehydrogenase (short-subunit alcohol dehydrogenase family)
VFDTLS